MMPPLLPISPARRRLTRVPLLFGALLLGPGAAVDAGAETLEVDPLLQPEQRLEATICGVIRLAPGAREGALQPGAPVSGVAVRLLEVDGDRVGVPVRWTLSDREGRFCLEGVPTGTLVLGAERIGLVSTEVRVQLEPEAVALGGIEILVATRALELPGLVVTAREVSRHGSGETGPGSRSRIDRPAIEHLQATSLADLLQLVPGQLAGNPTLASPGQSLLRQVPTTAEAARANALGTSILLDGAPISNNANLQTDVTILNAGPGSLPPFASVAGRGLDLRTFSPDEIEVLEVIRGIPSVRHGDLTTGLLSIETRIGARRPELRVRVNPTLLDLGWTAGWGDRPDRPGWNATATLTGSQDDPRQTLDNFYRGGVQLAWRTARDRASRSEAAVRLHAWRTLDERRRDPDDLRNQIERASRDQGVRLSTRGTVHPGTSGTPAWVLSWTGSASLTSQASRFQSLVGRSITPVTPATTDTTLVGLFGPSEYLNITTVDGRPIQLYGRFEFEWRGRPAAGLAPGEGRVATRVPPRWGGWRSRPVAGVEWRHEQNRGEGRQFDILTPPRQNYNVGDRPRSWREIPPLDMASIYAEQRMAGRLAGRSLDLQAGLRYDNVAPRGPFRGAFGTEVQPRANAALEVVPGVRLRVGAGRAAKAPPLAYLHPGPRYFDLINLNYFAPNPAERLLVITTRVVTPSNEGARSFTSTKREMGLDGARRGILFSVAAFTESTRGAYGWDRELVVFPVERFGIVEAPAGRPPTLTAEPIRVDTFYSAYDVPAATRDVASRGLEFSVDLPEWSRFRTSASLNGGWTRTRVQNRSQAINAGAFFFSSAPPARVGVYASDGTRGERLVTSLRLIHRAPEVGMVFSTLIQTLWRDRRQAEGVEALPRGFVDRAGILHPLTPEEARLPANADLVRPVSETFLAVEDPPALFLVNVRLSKTLPRGLEMALFVNNAPASRPLWENPRSGGFVQRNPPLFFGLEVVSRGLR